MEGVQAGNAGLSRKKKTIPNGGAPEGDERSAIIAKHPATTPETAGDRGRKKKEKNPVRARSRKNGAGGAGDALTASNSGASSPTPSRGCSHPRRVLKKNISKTGDEAGNRKTDSRRREGQLLPGRRSWCRLLRGARREKNAAGGGGNKEGCRKADLLEEAKEIWKTRGERRKNLLLPNNARPGHAGRRCGEKEGGKNGGD